MLRLFVIRVSWQPDPSNQRRARRLPTKATHPLTQLGHYSHPLSFSSTSKSRSVESLFLSLRRTSTLRLDIWIGLTLHALPLLGLDALFLQRKQHSPLYRHEVLHLCTRRRCCRRSWLARCSPEQQGKWANGERQVFRILILFHRITSRTHWVRAGASG